MRQRLGLVVAAALAAGVVWLASGALPVAARLWTTGLLGLLPPLLVLQAAAVEDAMGQSRTALYASTMVSLWLLAGVTVAVAAASGWGFAELRMRPVAVLPGVAWTLGLTATALLVFLVARWMGLRESPLTAYLLPVSARERWWFVGVSLTAGIAEEVVFRGFLLTALALATGSLGLAVALSSAAFGVMHGYQGMAGAARPALLGVLFAAATVATGSLLPAVAAHTAVDVVSGLWLGRRLLR